MIRCTALALVAGLAFVAAADEPPAKKDEKKAPAKAAPQPAKMGVMQLPVPKGDSQAAKDYAEVIKATNEQLKTATTPEESSKILAATAGKIVAHARKHPTDESTLNALTMAVSLSSRSPAAAKDRGEALDLIKTNFAKTPLIRKQLRMLANGIDDASADVVREVFKNHPEKLTQAHAAKALISGLEQREQMADRLGKNEAMRMSFEKNYGKDTVQKLIDGAPAAKKEVEEYRTALRTTLKGQLPDLEIGAVAPETISVNVDGKSVKLSDLKGKVVVLDFWATWCGPCRAMIPHTRELVKGLDGKPFVFVSISADDEKETLTKFLDKESMPWTHWWDEKKAVVQQWEIEGYPTVYVLDHKGVIRFKSLGLSPEMSKKMDATIEELVKAAQGDK